MNIVFGIAQLLVAIFAFGWANKAEDDKKWVSAVFYFVFGAAALYYAGQTLGW